MPPGVSRKSRRETAPGTTLNSARSMAMRYGMEEDLGHVAYDTEPPNLLGLPEQRSPFGPRPSERTTERIDESVTALLDNAFDRATEILTKNRTILDCASADLLKRETLDEAALAVFARELVHEPSDRMAEPASALVEG